MFQYAAARQLALRYCTDFRIDATHFGKLTRDKSHSLQLIHFNISAVQATETEIERYLPKRSRLSRIRKEIRRLFRRHGGSDLSEKVYEEPAGSQFRPNFFELGADRYLIGYFNSYKYFDEIRDVLLREFAPKEELSTQTHEMIRQIEDTPSVGLHIRRGDYVTDPGVERCVAGIITDQYYRNAVAYLRQHIIDPHFYVFSDDMPWVKIHFQIPGTVTYVDINPPERGFEDLWMLSRCRHNIAAGGSTFSWWAAYLNRHPDKIVVRTGNISNDPLYNHPEDYFPPEWIVVPS
jgi:hypothetical protein